MRPSELGIDIIAWHGAGVSDYVYTDSYGYQIGIVRIAVTLRFKHVKSVVPRYPQEQPC